MKLLRKAVLVGWALSLTVGAASALTAAATTTSAVGGVAAHDTGWG